MKAAEFSRLAGMMDGYVITDRNERRAFREAAQAAQGDITKMPEPWRQLMLDNEDLNLADFNEPTPSSFGFSRPDPLFTPGSQGE